MFKANLFKEICSTDNPHTAEVKIVIGQIEQNSSTPVITMEMEVIAESLMEAFLTEVSVERGFDRNTAQAQAIKSISSYTSPHLRKNYHYTNRDYSRVDVSNLYLSHLRDACNVDIFSVLGSAEDDEFWYALFPETIHTCPVLTDLPELSGTLPKVQEAKAIRRRHIVELLLLKIMLSAVISEPHNYYVVGTEDTPVNFKNFVHDSHSILSQLFKERSESIDVEEWLANKHIKYDINWLKQKEGLPFFDPTVISVTPIGCSHIMDTRSMYFDLLPLWALEKNDY